MHLNGWILDDVQNFLHKCDWVINAVLYGLWIASNIGVYYNNNSQENNLYLSSSPSVYVYLVIKLSLRILVCIVFSVLQNMASRNEYSWWTLMVLTYIEIYDSHNLCKWLHGPAVCGFLSILRFERIDLNHQFIDHTQAIRKIPFKTRIINFMGCIVCLYSTWYL